MPHLRQKLAFLLSGGIGFVLYYTFSLLLFRYAGLAEEAAAFIAVLLSVTPTFALQKHFAFRHRGGTLRTFVQYCALQVFNAAMVGILAGIGRSLGVLAEVNFVVSGATVAVLSYLVLSRIVFRAGPPPPGDR